MKKFTFVAMSAIALTAFTFTGLSAQQQFGGNSHPGADRLSFTAFGGGLFSTSALGGGTEFENTGTLGGNVTFWATHNLGVRANVLWSPPDIRSDRVGINGPPLVGEDPNVWHYSGDVVLRLPLPATANISFFPYLLGGLGAKTYDFETLGTETDFAGNFGAGLEFRFGETGRWGINTEIRDFVSNFDRAGFDRTLHDVVWTGGLTLNF